MTKMPTAISTINPPIPIPTTSPTSAPVAKPPFGGKNGGGSGGEIDVAVSLVGVELDGVVSLAVGGGG